MVGSVDRIERDIAGLEEAIAALAQEFQVQYKAYLTSLGQAVRQQLIWASYHLCTQGYPEAFLELSFSQRQQLQQALQRVGQAAQGQLLDQLRPPEEFFEEEDEPESALQAAIAPTFPEEDGCNSGDEPAAAIEPADASSPDAITDDAITNPPPEVPVTPDLLIDWQEDLEDAITDQLALISRDANVILQRFGILPRHLPESVLEAAAKVEMGTEMRSSSPNLLNLLVETESDDEQSAMVSQVMALYLRLGEIEFAEPTLLSLRQRLRGLVGRLQGLARDYQAKCHERAIAQAQHAWRASWYES